MSSRPYTKAQQKAIEAIKSDNESIFLSVTSVDENGGTDIEVISGVDSSTIQEGHGLIRLEQAAMHVQYLADISGMTPMEVAGSIGKVIESGEVDIDTSMEVKE